ncbi:MAG: hypothetical protein AM326_05130 [Candidatus Thorarchaeota archaeon SMTZ-45]|nr:MAG: hypothetical protein AM325_16350 [Candidatus Thorarchaeota archaeon SMTZ1-45]KXH77414.1 MAG: hypothetical protein AM326_05130 [Candidatus Thorarchaeota archaeon SMTZ-45]
MYNARIKTKKTKRVAPLGNLNISLERVITGRLVRILAALAGMAGLAYLVMLVPGMIVVALPGGIAAASKVYDEARLIQYLRYGDPINPGVWETTELSTEMARIKASDNRDVSVQFSK